MKIDLETLAKNYHKSRQDELSFNRGLAATVALFWTRTVEVKA